jgi:GH24 family phage-related lysozyme (muramidase)
MGAAMQVSDRGRAPTEASEGLRTVAYQDGAGIWTINYSHTAGVRPGDTCVREQADTWRREDPRGVWRAFLWMSIRLSQGSADVSTKSASSAGAG